MLDNYLAFARIMKQYYFPLIQIADKDYFTVRSKYYPCRVDIIHEAVGGLIAVINCVMSRIIDVAKTPNIMERYIKIFLSAIHRID